LVKLLIVGHGRHGKDTVSEILNKISGLRFESSSMHCAQEVLFPMLKDKYGYTTVSECFNDRHNHRAEWYDAISDYCKEDLTRIGREIFDYSDIYCGLRNKEEMMAMRKENVFDYAIWVDRSEHLPPEPVDSMNITEDMCDYSIDNNGTLEELEVLVFKMLSDLELQTN